MGTLTIRENLMFSANMRLSTHYSEEEKKERVAEAIDDLDLNHCADTRVSNILRSST